ncbi:MAG: phosphotransferase [Ilumatobacteraceae bacterium]|nr:phosphotransferase [Ilumatobacteraceae bacterium]
MAAPPYEDLTMRAQVHRLRQVALAATDAYPFEVRRLRLLLHAYNTTFRVDTTDGRRFALRINTNSLKSDANLDAEVAWLDAISRETEVVVPTPQRTCDERLRTDVRFEPLQRSLPVVVMSWLPGRDLDDGTPDGFRALGRTMALLHEHALTWTPPTGAAFPMHDAVLFDIPNVLATDHPLLTDESRALFAEALGRGQQAYDDVLASGPVIPIHADLHGGNAKWLRGRLSVFDFDDAATGVPLQDLAISSYYLRDDDVGEQALLAGYEEVRPRPATPTADYEAIVAARNVLLANEVLRMSTADMREIAPTFLANSVLRLRAFLDTGVYRREVDGVVPLPG